MLAGGNDNYERLNALRDFASAIAIICTVTSCFMEPSLLTHSTPWNSPHRKLNREWSIVHNDRLLQQALWMIPVDILVNLLTFNMVCYACHFLRTI